MATRKSRKIARKEGSSGQFLLSQTDIRKVEEAPPYRADCLFEALSGAFPGILRGKAFQEQILQRLEDGQRFASLAIRPDDPPDEELPPAGTHTLVDLAACLDEACRGTAGCWGVVDTGMIAVFQPGLSGGEGLEAARHTQERIRSRTGRTVTIGVAAYPTIDYAPQAVLENACKAAEHAAFFGPNSRVVFDAVSLNISGDKFYERGDIRSAMHEFHQALRLDPQNVNVRNSLGVCYGVAGDYERALAEFAEVLRLENREHMAVYNMGLIHLLCDRKQAALECFLKAHALRADVFEILFQTGKLYLDTGRSQAARPYLEHAARLRTRSGSMYRALGDCYAALDLPEKATSAYKKAVQANPEDSMALSALGCLFDAREESPEIAMLLCRESVRLDPTNALLRRRLGSLYFKLNRLEEALAEFEQAGRLGHDATEDIQKIRSRMEGLN
jgi:tetratricopeptide (TPR) repeat protein